MKKKMAMAVMALAVSAMAGSAFAASEPAKTKEAIFTKDGDLTTSFSLIPFDAYSINSKMISLEEMAKEKGISVEELIEQLEKEGKFTQGKAVSFIQPAISLEQMAKEKGISVEELIKLLEKEGITRGETVTPVSQK
ncbi:hypothetical protein [Brevibacillus sp. DP1.3A]|uniref:hypothetical protein n=1 Tax=Brevibacillus sp. DP1.3A TaxID=2738867 RepID=UPI00156AA7F6|nr:hypothetical protein [Brevibacillus sp. DP1.3A]UED75341.1 hypothetical protein HP399_002275 [Brevibacillus sp. DP1.3A]